MTPVNIMVGYFFYKKMPLYKVYRFIFYLPAVIPATVLATLFKYIIAPDSSGLISSLLANIGVQMPNLLGSSEYAMKTLIVYAAWTGVTGFLLTSNAMNRVPTEIVESARLDGVTPVQEVVRILVPLIWPTIATSLLLSVMNIFTSSGPILLFTQGNHGTYTVAYWLFEKVMTVTYFYGHYFQGGKNFAPLLALLRFIVKKAVFMAIFASNLVIYRKVRVQSL